jgi:acyl-CoA thioester hydrolase
MTIFRVPVQRRFSDIDVLGHVNNVVYHDYLQEARVRIIREMMNTEDVEFSHIVARQEIDHLRPLALGAAPITVEIWVSGIGGASYTVDYRVLDDDGEIAAKAKSVMVFYNIELQAPTRIPDDVRAVLTNMLETGERDG